jgi:hypothetical protein
MAVMTLARGALRGTAVAQSWSWGPIGYARNPLSYGTGTIVATFC